MQHNPFYMILVVCGFIGVGCANDPVTFSQSEGVKRISINVEAASSDDAVAAEDASGNIVEAGTPAIDAGEDKVRTLIEGFDSASGEDFDPDQFFDVAGSEDPDATIANDLDAKPESKNKESSDGAETKKENTTTDTATEPKADTEEVTAVKPSGDSEDPASADTVPANKSEVKLCAKLAGVDPESVILEQPTTLSSGSVLALKITGNKADIELDLAGDAAASLQGLCIFMAGNQAKLTAKIGLSIQNLLFVGRGNEGNADITVEGNGSISAAVISLKGNNTLVNFKSNGKPACADVFVFAKKGGFQCQ